MASRSECGTKHKPFEARVKRDAPTGPLRSPEAIRDRREVAEKGSAGDKVFTIALNAGRNGVSDQSRNCGEGGNTVFSTRGKLAGKTVLR